jgi:uncharacterized protein YndB with AHSA1/START domain
MQNNPTSEENAVAERSVTHATFVIERTFDSTPALVFAAWADPAAKRRWFGPPDESARSGHALDFRVGGRETNSGRGPSGELYTFEALYQDIVSGERIVYTYDMLVDQTRMSVSLATVELTPEGDGTRMVYTEQGAYLDGKDTPAQREHGTRELFDALARELRREHATA